jgi:hypothetical protein
VRTGTGATTPSLPFTVAPDLYSITSLSPPTAYQGDGPVSLAFQGTSFPNPGAVIEVQPPGGTFGGVAVTPGTSTASMVTGTISLAGQPEGSWLARIAFSDGTFSAAWPFRVLSNQAILRDRRFAAAGARRAAGATKTTVTFQVANLRPPYSGVKVAMFDP